MLYPTRYMIAKVPISETGTTTPGMMVARTFLRNTKTTSTTRPIEIRSDSSTFLTDARIVTVWSSTGLSATSAGTSARRYGSSARIRSTVSMMLTPGWRKMTRTTAVSPLDTAPARRSSTAPCTRATSIRRTGAPLRQATIKGS